LKLVLIIGDSAVGKMTVGQKLAKITDLRLFHNHMMIEPVLEIFGYFNGKAIAGMREVIFEEFAKSEHYGLIFTYMWAFDSNLIGIMLNMFVKFSENIMQIYVM